MEAVTPPLFLRFVNLLMNDAVFLLDEALSNMAQLRQMQTAREAGEWQQLSSHENEQNEGYMEHIGMITRFVSSNTHTHTYIYIYIYMGHFTSFVYGGSIVQCFI